MTAVMDAVMFWAILAWYLIVACVVSGIGLCFVFIVQEAYLRFRTRRRRNRYLTPWQKRANRVPAPRSDLVVRS